MKTEEKSLSFVGKGKNTLSNQEDKPTFQFESEAHIPGADTTMKTIILACDPELAEELGISMEERLGAFLEHEPENEG